VNLGEIESTVNEYHGRGLFLDASLTVLLVVGAVSPARVARHKRTSTYTSADFHLLVEFCTFFARLVTLPNILTEASDLLRNQEEQLMLKTLCIDIWEEATIESRLAAAAHEYSYLGLADAAILQRIAGSFLVLTDDGPLVAAIQANAGGVLHFDWLRQLR
jgi:hypothetical protein